jgi:hypothetical protein
VQLFIKSKCDTPEFILTLQKIIDASSLQYIKDFLNEVIQKCVKIVDNNDAQTYLRKIEASNLLRSIALKLKDTADLVFGYVHASVIKCLEQAQCDRVLKVR